MALTKGTNSYVTVAEADAYFENRLDVAAWNSADDENKSKALITATGLLDELSWTGVVEDSSQSLAFPRVGSYFDPKIGYSVSFDEGTVPDRIVKATYELAYHLLNNDGLLDNTGSAVDLEVGRIKLKRVNTADLYPSVVTSLINPLKVNGGARLWWRAN
jgi:hypothetical protein